MNLISYKPANVLIIWKTRHTLAHSCEVYMNTEDFYLNLTQCVISERFDRIFIRLYTVNMIELCWTFNQS